MSMIDWLKKLVQAKDHESSPTDAHSQRTSIDGSSASNASPDQPRHAQLPEIPGGNAGPITMDESLVVGGLDFASAIRAHQAWKGRLSAIVAGASEEKLDYRVVCRDDKCVLGQWIHSAGHDAFGHYPVFRDVWLTHKEFHRIAGSVIEAMDAGQVDVAKQILRGDYLRVSVRVQGLLAELFINVNKDLG